ncbi:MAG: 1-deoxy-D-xylulose-5-phosphate synthase [Acidimicrobiia bacterium]|nr:1-deoxy-D-xylulose-5-phosphate synthase [Acidimicrobiia bacterium]
MVLESIDSPADLRRLDAEALDALASEIRQLIVDRVTAGGGHLGSNLGVVELTLAMHRVFDSPNDLLLWDTGHQAYVHKIVTGRWRDFEQLRRAGGLSGYPSRAESAHDWIENSHASTILSYAHGLATARDLGYQPEPRTDAFRHIVAVIGDGSMTGGMAFEGLNNLGHSGRRVIIVLNDNGRSYAPTVSHLSHSLIKLRLDPRVVREQDRVGRVVERLPIGRQLERGWNATKAAIREMWQPRAFFEDLGIRYTGPVDGHDLGELEQALRNAAEYDAGPILLHVLTQKGRGYGPAEEDPVKKLHDLSEFKAGSFTAAFSDALIKEADANPAVVAITAAMPDSTGLLPFRDRFPDRMVDVGIAEQHAVTSAAGMAMGGLRPVVAVYSTFLTRAIDQVNLDVGMHDCPVVFALDRAGITGDDGPSHHGILDMVLLTKVPNMTVFAPSSYQELQQMLHDALLIDDGPSAIRWPKTTPVNVGPDEIGSGLAARNVRRGDGSVCFVGVGKMLAAALEAADALEADGVRATVWDPRVVKPLDPAMIEDLVRHRVLVVAEDGLRDGGVGSAVAALTMEAACAAGAHCPQTSCLGVPATYLAHGSADGILRALGLDGAGLLAEARRLLAAVG